MTPSKKFKPMKLFFLVNPVSGGIDKEPFLKKAKELCDLYGIDYEIFKTTGENDREGFLKSLEEFKPDKVLAVGGDGTVLFTAVTLLESHLPMGIIPLGSANGMATELFVDPDPVQALRDVIMSDLVEGLDLLLINEKHYALHIGDVGINAGIVEAYEKDPKRGMITYAKYFIEEMSQLKPFRVVAETDADSYEGEVLMAAICNARKYGTGVPLNDVGNPMDGEFELVFLEKVDVPTLIRAGLASFNDKFHDSQVSTLIRAKRAKLTFDKPRLLQLDGEVAERYKTVDIQMLPGAIRLITTRKNKNISL